ncbi:MAG TPA: tetratricopeptide repeat protein [Bryobacteraceae bacterium]|nr:tetratricopeptide repeat protein [Bryobacteraceae bacterium]
MPDPLDPKEPSDPLVLIPVTAEDVSRRKRKIVSICCAAALAILFGAYWIYQRSTAPVQARESFDAGERLLKVARYSEAILSFDRAIDLQPGFAGAYLDRGRAHMGNYEQDEAVADFTKAIQLRPHNAQALLDRGEAYLFLKNFSAAAADASAAIAANPNLAEAYNLRATAVRDTGDPQKAVADFDRAVQLAPNADNYYQRGATYQELGEHKLAIADFTQTIAFETDLAQAYFARAESERAIGNLAAAKKDHEQARILDGR